MPLVPINCQRCGEPLAVEFIQADDRQSVENFPECHKCAGVNTTEPCNLEKDLPQDDPQT